MSDLQHLYNRQDTHRPALYRQRDSNTFSQVVENLIGICDGPHIWGIDIFFIPKRLHEATDSDIDTLPVKVQEIISDIQSDEALIGNHQLDITPLLHFSLCISSISDPMPRLY